MKRVYTATEKTTGFQYLYEVRSTFGRQEYRVVSNDQWHPTLKAAKASAKNIGRFRYNHEPALKFLAA